jgi:hypothetical protein
MRPPPIDGQRCVKLSSAGDHRGFPKLIVDGRPSARSHLPANQVYAPYAIGEERFEEFCRIFDDFLHHLRKSEADSS